MSRRLRDQYKKALYAAEEEAFGEDNPNYGRNFETILEAQKWIHMVQSVDPLLEHLSWISVREAHGNAKASWAVYEDNAISLTPAGMNEQVILHELAHLATDSDLPFHGREFAWNYLDLTLRWRGPSVYLELRNAIRDRGII